MERDTPPPASMPASHAVSCGAVGADDAVDAAGVGFTAKLVRLGTKAVASLFTPGVGGEDPCRDWWWLPPHFKHGNFFGQSVALWPTTKHLKQTFLFLQTVDLSSTLKDE